MLIHNDAVVCFCSTALRSFFGILFLLSCFTTNSSACPFYIKHLESDTMYTSLQDAYDDVAALGFATLLVTASDLSEDVVCNQDVVVTLEGGYDCDFNFRPGVTKISGNMLIKNGTVSADRITLTNAICDSSHVTLCTISDDCAAMGGYWWSNDTCLGVPESETVVSAGGRIWMDRNLGASQVATSVDDSEAYGDLYQWGRDPDGHQLRTSVTTSTLSSTDNPGHPNFIITEESPPPRDWRDPQNDNLWQGEYGTNNPCPAGFRLPTLDEWNTEMASWGDDSNSTGAFNSPLKLVVAGARLPKYGTIDFGGLSGNYWSSTSEVSNGSSFASSLNFDGFSAFTVPANFRATGLSVRCIKD